MQGLGHPGVSVQLPPSNSLELHGLEDPQPQNSLPTKIMSIRETRYRSLRCTGLGRRGAEHGPATEHEL